MVLLALAMPLGYAILERLADGPLAERELLEKLHAGRTSCFAHLRKLSELGVIDRQREATMALAFCGLREPQGGEMLKLGRLLAADYGAKRGEELPDATVPRAANALAIGWTATVLRWVGERPRGLSELDRLAPVGVGAADIKRALKGLGRVGLTRRQPAGRRPRTELSARTAPLARQLAGAVRWHRRYRPQHDRALDRLDAECLLLLAGRGLPASGLGGGSCGLVMNGLGGVRLSDGGGGVSEAAVLSGESCEARLEGSADAWLELLVDADPGGLRVEGEKQIGEALLNELRASAQAP